jgi:hypothetical protein
MHRTDAALPTGRIHHASAFAQFDDAQGSENWTLWIIARRRAIGVWRRSLLWTAGLYVVFRPVRRGLP